MQINFKYQENTQRLKQELAVTLYFKAGKYLSRSMTRHSFGTTLCLNQTYYLCLFHCNVPPKLIFCDLRRLHYYQLTPSCELRRRFSSSEICHRHMDQLYMDYMQTVNPQNFLGTAFIPPVTSQNRWHSNKTRLQ